MKRLLIYILIVALLFAACLWIIVGRSRAGTPAPTPPIRAPIQNSGGADATPATAQPAPSAVPVSGSDLFVPEPFSPAAQAALSALRLEMEAKDCVCALAYLGAASAGEPLAGTLETSGVLSALAEETARYAFLTELTPAHCADTGFAKLCCLVPLDKDTAVCVQAPGMEDYQGPPGAPVLFATDDISLSISLLHADGSQTEFSRKDPLGTQPGVLDFSLPMT